MLDVLRSIIQEVNAAQNLDQALAIIVQRVKPVMISDVCSVYLLDQSSSELVLMASDGLHAESVGSVRISIEKGLVGLVAQRAEPINLDNAPDHPRYLYISETGEEKYHAFLGIPIIHHRQVLGVLVLQKFASVQYDEDSITFLITIAAQLAGAIIHAEITGGIDILLHQSNPDSLLLKGIPGTPGIGIGHAVVVYSQFDIEGIPDRTVENIDAELEIFLRAVKAVKKEIKIIIENVAEVLSPEDIALFNAYLLMLDSNSLVEPVCNGIRQGNWASGALREVAISHIRAFDEMEDPYLRERAEDVRDLCRRILLQLKKKSANETSYSENTILVGEEIPASMLAEVPLKYLAGVVTMRGSSTSHMAILAHALGIPAVLGVSDLPVVRMEGLNVIIDGYSGDVFVNAPNEVKKEYIQLKNEEKALNIGLDELRDLDSVTTDGVHVSLYANTGLLSDIRPTLNSGAAGIGLYRTEFPFIMSEKFIGENEQYDIYRQVLEGFAPRPVTMRTLDIGGDKALSYFPIEEDNPFLGWRGIRITLDHPDIFLMQIRAMLRANAGQGNLRILLPMISTIPEVDEALQLIQRAYTELAEENYDIIMPPVGVMVEVPSMVYQIGALAKRVDFLSIGSNDLTQYLLAVDRNNARVAGLYDSLDPSVILALRSIITDANKYDIPVTVCGEMASDPMAAIILLGLGSYALSMSVSSLSRIKWVIRTFSRRRARQILKKVLEMEDSKSIRSYLSTVLEKAGLGGLIRAGK